MYLKSSHAKTTLGMKMKFDFKLEIPYIFCHFIEFPFLTKMNNKFGIVLSAVLLVEILYFKVYYTFDILAIFLRCSL